VGIEHSFSDHRYIEFTITLGCPPAENITNLRLTNRGYYNNLLNRNLHSPPTHIRNGQELVNLVNTFTDIYGEALKRACPSRAVKSKHKPPWWNATLANLKRECRTYFNRAKYNNSESSWNLYLTKLSLYKKEIRILKRRAWANFCSRNCGTAEASRLRRILAKSPATIGYLKTNADSWTEKSQETLELLLDTHFPKNTQVVEDLYIEENLDDRNIDNISKPGRIQWAVNSFKPLKSPGQDGFFPAQLQRTLVPTLADSHLPRLPCSKPYSNKVAGR